ncbi:MAG: cation:dicarboxylase symporter family transporter, partial [Verrucomicrobia bacterium]|nr:cation:dicarboxylase symporter family transporter [Verrucomicrobiota bacterium]
ASFLKMASVIVLFLPLGIWAFIAIFCKELQETGFAPYKSLFLYFSVVVLANLIQGLVVLPLLLKAHGFSPTKIFKGMLSAISLAFFSKSSSATLPVTMRCLRENLGVNEKVSSFSLPLCTTVNMNACAAFIFTTVIFVSMSAGHVFSIGQMLLWVFIATLAAIGNAGVPMGCYFLAGALLSGQGVPLELLGMILPLYALLDMLETAINVWSDACVTLVVAKEVEKASPSTPPLNAITSNS